MSVQDQRLKIPEHITSMEEYRRLYELSLAEPVEFWRAQAARLTWFHPFHTVRDIDMEEIDFGWYLGGRLNAAYNCVDRHLEERGDKTAIIWAAEEPGRYEHISYRKLKHQVARVANVLLAHGVRRGDRVAIYMPMIPEAVYAMLACARIGAVHTVVFAGFSAESLRERIVDADARVLLTANEGRRGGKAIPLKAIADRAVAGLSSVRSVLVARRTDTEVPMEAGRDHWLGEEMRKQRSTCPIEWMSAEAPLFILYTSGSTGKPKGVLHTTGGYLVYTSMTHQHVFGLQPDDVYFCAADICWITGHSYLVYGPLANGATTVLFETTPTYPDAGRYWQIVEDLGVNILYTAPTAIRALARAGDEYVTPYDRSSLRVLGTVGEPISPDAWTWYHDVVGEGRCAVVDTYWQTETGGIVISPLAGVTETKPGSATLPMFGVHPIVKAEDGATLEDGDVEGLLAIDRSWPGHARTIWGDHSRFKETYFARFPAAYFTGDGCRSDGDGYFWITGRVDDVLNVSGHRLGTAEIESALNEHTGVSESAVVGFPHEIKGMGIYAFVRLTDEFDGVAPGEIVGAVKDQVRQSIGPFAVPDHVLVVADLPKTRSGKIMRRILRNIACGNYDDLGDVTTLAEPAVVEPIVQDHRDSGSPSG
ncbi:MAG: acetate--CoA ligase [Deltaproteobacteria bacterium]|nr:acetate--CoA ligase [Deltaproteobacteria bacterium]